jgi:hypothetical protein
LRGVEETEWELCARSVRDGFLQEKVYEGVERTIMSGRM